MAIKDNLKNKGAVAGGFVEVPVEIPAITDPVPSIAVSIDPKYIAYGFNIAKITTINGNKYNDFKYAEGIYNSIAYGYSVHIDKNVITITAINEANYSIANITGFTAYCVM